MIKEQIIQVPETEKQQDKDNDTTIPDWVRNNASWWSSNQISDKEFASGLQFPVWNNYGIKNMMCSLVVPVFLNFCKGCRDK